MEKEVKHSDPCDGGLRSRKYRIARESFWAVWAVGSVALFWALTTYSEEAVKLGIDGSWYLWLLGTSLTFSQGVFGVQNVAGKTLLGRISLAKSKLMPESAKKDE